MQAHRAATALMLAALITGGSAIAAGVDATRPVAAQASDDPSSATTVELLSPGLRPRAPLRITTPAGSTVTGTFTMDLLIQQKVLGQSQTPINATVRADLRMTVTAVDASGHRTVSFAYENSNVPTLNGLTGTYVVSDRGITGSGSFQVPPGIDAATQQTLSQLEDQVASLSTPFPVEAVGNGARWRVTQHPEINGVSTTQSIVYHLLQRKDAELTLESTVHQSAPSQPLKSSDLPAGTTARLVKSVGRGNGDITLDLDAVLPSSSTANVRVQQILDLHQAGAQVRVSQTLVSKVSISST